MRMEYGLVFPSEENAYIKLITGLEVLLAARDYFRKSGLDRDEIYSVRISNIRDEENIITFKDGASISKREFNDFNDLDGLLKEMIGRYCHFSMAKTDNQIDIHSSLYNLKGYSALFHLRNLKQHGFLANGYDTSNWKLYTLFTLDNPFIGKEEAERYSLIKSGLNKRLEEVVGHGLKPGLD